MPGHCQALPSGTQPGRAPPSPYATKHHRPSPLHCGAGLRRATPQPYVTVPGTAPPSLDVTPRRLAIPYHRSTAPHSILPRHCFVERAPPHPTSPYPSHAAHIAAKPNLCKTSPDSTGPDSTTATRNATVLRPGDTWRGLALPHATIAPHYASLPDSTVAQLCPSEHNATPPYPCDTIRHPTAPCTTLPSPCETRPYSTEPNRTTAPHHSDRPDSAPHHRSSTARIHAPRCTTSPSPNRTWPGPMRWARPSNMCQKLVYAASATATSSRISYVNRPKPPFLHCERPFNIP